jgi:DNA-binding response OmpR family regulator
MPTAIHLPAPYGDGRAKGLRLTRKERDLLAFLRQNAGRCLSRDLLLSRVWGYREGVKSRTLDVHVQRLRRKLGPVEGAHLLTVFRAGYLWSATNGEAPDGAGGPASPEQAPTVAPVVP